MFFGMNLEKNIEFCRIQCFIIFHFVCMHFVFSEWLALVVWIFMRSYDSDALSIDNICFSVVNKYLIYFSISAIAVFCFLFDCVFGFFLFPSGLRNILLSKGEIGRDTTWVKFRFVDLLFSTCLLAWMTVNSSDVRVSLFGFALQHGIFVDRSQLLAKEVLGCCCSCWLSEWWSLIFGIR